MKTTLFFLLLIVLNINNSISQNTFELLLDYDNAQRPTGLIIDKNGNYVISSQEFMHINKNIEYNSMLTKISQTGEVIDTAYFNTEQEIVILDLINTENNDYILVGGDYTDNNEELCLIIILLDEDFNIIWKKKHINGKKITNAKIKLNSNNEILIFGSLKEGEVYNSFILKINTNGELLNFKILSSTGSISCIFDIIEKKDETGYYLFMLDGTSVIMEINNEFDIITNKNMPYVIANSNNSYWLTDSTYILSGKVFDNNSDLALVVADTAHNFIYTFNAEKEEHDFPAVWDNLSFTNKNNIYLVGTNNMSSNPYEIEPSFVFVNNLNDTLGLNWQKLIGGDAFYSVMNIIATEDGGCFIAATRSDNTNSYDYDMYFLKLDPNGNITHINGEPSEQKAKEVILYPNPATTQLTIQKAVQVGNCNVEFYNITGKKVFYQELTSNTTKIDISNLQKGSYIYKITDNNKILDSGKWIKQ